jgi:sulfite exporter TauE/SafE
MEIFAGLILGLIGSFHCAGMCGAIALSLPVPRGGKGFIRGRVLYNSGRVITYTLMGAVFGLIGGRLNIIGLQQAAAILIGAVILAGLISPKIYNRLYSIPLLNKAVIKLKIMLKDNFGRNSNTALLGTGILNGLLPCGFVYAGIAGAVTLGGAFSSGLFMMFFGLGTVPVMLGLSLGGVKIKALLGGNFRKFVPALSFLLAVLFILRGLNLGIPYISPKFESHKDPNTELLCH